MHKFYSEIEKAFRKAVLDNDLSHARDMLGMLPELANAQWDNMKGEHWTVLHLAAAQGHGDMAALLLEYGAELNATVSHMDNDSGKVFTRTPLGMAYAMNKSDTAIALKLLGAKYDPAKPARESEVFKTAMLGRFESIERLYRLEEMGAPPVIVENQRKSARVFDTITEFIAQKGGKLAKRVPPETINGKDNPEFLAFAQVVSLAYALKNSTTGNPETIAELLERTKGSWQDIARDLKPFSQRDAYDLEDTLLAFAEPLLLPEIARQGKHLIQARKMDVRAALDELLPDVANMVMGDRGMATILDLQRDWHADRATLEASIRNPEFARSGNWPPLAGDFTAKNGLTLSFVTTAQALADLGEKENHCVGGYAGQCTNEPVHIGVIKQGEKVLSTFELHEKPNSENKVKLVQHRGKGNAEIAPDAPEAAALWELRKNIRDGGIAVDFAGLKKARKERIKTAAAVGNMIGFDPYADDSPARETNALRQYLNVRTGGREDSVVKRSNPFIPGGQTKWGDISAKEFLEQTGLMDRIKQVIANPPKRDDVEIGR